MKQDTYDDIHAYLDATIKRITSKRYGYIEDEEAKEATVLMLYLLVERLAQISSSLHTAAQRLGGPLEDEE